MNLDDIKELAVIRNVQPNDVLVVTMPDGCQPDVADRIGVALKARIGCKVIVVSDGVQIGTEVAA